MPLLFLLSPLWLTSSFWASVSLSGKQEDRISYSRTLPYLVHHMLGDPSSDRYMAYGVCKCQKFPELVSTQLFGKWGARGGHLGPATGKSTKAWRWDALGMHAAKPCRWTVCALPSEQGWAHGSVNISLLHHPLEAAPKVTESVGVFLLCFWKPEVSASVTLTDDICSLFGNTLFKSNLRWD